MKRISPAYWGSQRSIGGIVFVLLFVFLFTGCSTTGQQLSSPVADMKQLFGISQYYVKSYTTVRAKPDSTSRSLGKISANTKVTEITKDELGWSQVRVVDGKLEGWVPTSSLSARPVKEAPRASRAKEKSGQRSTAQKEEAPVSEASQGSAPSSQAEETKTTEEEQSGGSLLSPAPAAAEPIPSASPPPPAPPPGRKASPDMFDSF